jgi:lipoprotein signal peptidase
VRDYQWPAFNIADSAIVIGSVLLALGLLRPKQQAANVP